MIPKVGEFLKSKGLDLENYVIKDISNSGYIAQIPIATWLEEYSNVKAKYYVTEALKQASEVLECYPSERDEILNAYSLDNIK